MATKIKGEESYRKTDAEKEGQKLGQEAGAKIDSTVRSTFHFPQRIASLSPPPLGKGPSPPENQNKN